MSKKPHGQDHGRAPRPAAGVAGPSAGPKFDVVHDLYGRACPQSTTGKRPDSAPAARARGDADARLRALFDQVRQGLLLIDIGSGRVEMINRFLRDTLGLDEGTLATLTLADLVVDSGDAPDCAPPLDHLLEPHDVPCTHDVVLRASAGTRLPVELVLTRGQGDAEGCIVASIPHLHDHRPREIGNQVLRDLAARAAEIGSLEAAINAGQDALEAVRPGIACCLGLIGDNGETMRWHANGPARQLGLCRIVAEETPPTDSGHWFGPVSELSPATSHILDGKGVRHVAWLLRDGTARSTCRIVLFTGDEPWQAGEREVFARVATVLNALLARIQASLQLQQNRLLLQDLAYHDSLTRLPNRSLLNDRLAQACATARREQKLLAVCYLDLDGFKAVNDRFGHEFGDRLLVTVADALSNGIREQDTAARLGGDEFVLLLGGAANEAEIRQTISRILDSLTQAVSRLRLGLSVSASIGVTIYPTDAVDQEILLRHADQAMYTAKTRGGERVHVFEPGSPGIALDIDHQYDLLRRAIFNDRLLLHFQPQVHMRTGEIHGVEALLRMRRPDGSLALPHEFLPVAMNSTGAKVLDEWVIQQSLRQIERWQVDGIELPISVNIHGTHLLQDGFAPRLEQFLWEHPKVPIGSLHLEILETSALENIGRAAATIHACRPLGVGFSLDDFGTGYSSLTYLRRLAVTDLKLDRSFVIGMLDDAEDFAIVEGIVALARAFNRRTIAEGVESLLHGEMLVKAGCDMAQGYFIAPPMAPADLPAWMRDYRHPDSWRKAPNTVNIARDSTALRLEIQHRQWLRRVLDLAARRQSDDDGSARDCAIGRWLHGETHDRLRQHAVYPDLLEAHEKIHRHASELIAARGQHADETAEETRARLMLAHDHLLQLLRDVAGDRPGAG
jgi:diguanylate cyclase (GGDEF)-like protein